jgi:Uma2 family endonuclease
MGTLAPHRVYTIEEYVQLEKYSNVKHEFYAGQIWAMSGGTPDHSSYAANIIMSLGRQLAGRPCRVHTSDARVRVRATGLDTYPDVSVVCGQIEFDADDRNAVTNPIVIVEVLSKGTEVYDRGEKLVHYKQIPSLQEIVLVAHDGKRLDLVRRMPDGTWATSTAETIQLDSIGCSLSSAEVYFDPLA